MVHHIVKSPLSSTFMLVSMLGFFLSTFLIWDMSKTWGFTLAVAFGIFFIASVYNFTHGTDEDVLAVHEPHRHLSHLKAYRK